MPEKQQMSQSLILGVLLALAGGMLDAYTFLCRGGFFATAETGNIVMLGISAAQGEFQRAFYYILSIASFSIGIFTAEVLTCLDDCMRLHWRQWGLLLECAFLLFLSTLSDEYNLLVCLLVSYISAIQLETFRKFHGLNCATTMCTGNLRSASEAVYKRMFKHGKPGAYVHYALLAAFATGAMISGFMADYLGNYTVLLACIPLVASFLFMFIEEDIFHRG